MKTSGVASITCAALILLVAACAQAQRAENVNYRSPVMELPALAKSEPELGAHGRMLLGGDDDDSHQGGKGGNPAKAKWEPKTDRLTDIHFVQGVASGDPFAKSVILWTRLTAPSGAQNKPAFLDYCVSKDQKFKKCESRGTAVTDAAVDFTVKVEARGLKPNTKYFYQWRYRQNDRKAPVYSTIGRTRTLPRADEDIKRVRLAFFGCSQLPLAYFTAYGQIARMAERGEIDYNLHSGDYIYEGAQNGSATNILDPVGRVARTAQPEREILSLSDYRTRHNQYNTDVDTKRMRASAPLIPVWDDHEYTNNAYRTGAQNHQPATEGDWDERRLRALQVYYEMMPIRQANADDKQQIYRNFEVGKLLRLITLDTRIIGRDEQNNSIIAKEDPNRTILGKAQTEFVKTQLSAGQASQQWKLLHQQVLFIHRCDTSSSDQWDGYRESRRQVLGHIKNNTIDNVVIITGDIHTHWAAEVVEQACKNQTGYGGYEETGNGSLAVEFVSSAITSGYNVNGNLTASDINRANVLAQNPHVKMFDPSPIHKGFAVLTITPKHATSTWYFAPNLTVPGQYNTMIQGESWRVNAGTTKLVRVE
jgi:alkaline phosphatase D